MGLFVMNVKQDLRNHEVSQHKLTESPIPQIDGTGDTLKSVVNEPSYCKICKECPDDLESREDVNYHVMNDHEVKDVLMEYGRPWIEERKYCIRRSSPFEEDY